MSNSNLSKKESDAEDGENERRSIVRFMRKALFQPLRFQTQNSILRESWRKSWNH